MKRVSGFLLFITLFFLYVLLIFNSLGCQVVSPENALSFQDSTGTETGTGVPEEPKEKLDIENLYLDVFANPEEGVAKCQDIDFLFVVDNSGSMGDNQQTLINNFPVFVQGIEQWIPSLEKYHVGIVTTDAYNWNEEGCQKIGALVTRTGNYNEVEECGVVSNPDLYADGYRFMTNNDDLGSRFACAANVGSAGSGMELQLLSMMQAVEVYYNSPGQCNENFIRENALLVVVILTDEDDHSGDVAENWYDHLVWVKNGKPDNIVVLSIIPSGDGYYGAPILKEFTMLFKNGFIGDIDAANYADFFKDAISVIFKACYGEFPPEG
jgi:hypothetical protein